MKEKNYSKDLMTQLAEHAMMIRTCGMKNPSFDKPGKMIESLGPVRRQILSELKSDDIKDVRWLK